MIYLLLGAVALLLCGCDRDTVQASVQVTQTIGNVRPDLLFAYYGVFGDQIRQTAAHVNACISCAWGEPYWQSVEGRAALGEQVIAQMQAAVAAGIHRLIFATDFLTLTSDASGPNARYAYRGHVNDLRAFVDRLTALDLWRYCVALYTCDEPDLHGIGDTDMNVINSAVRRFGKPIVTIYTDRRQWPGLATCDWAGFDKYGTDVNGGGCLADLKGRLGPSQRVLLLAGGCDPYRDNVRPVLAYANQDPQVIGIVAFCYGSNYGGTTYKGIGENGMLPEYAAVGTMIKQAGQTQLEP